MRALVVVVALFGCRESEKQPPPPAVAKPAAPPAPAVVPPGKCENVDVVLVSKILADAVHPCRARVNAAYGRMVSTGSTGLAFSGTVVSTKPARGAGMFITCQHCTGANGDGLHEPETTDPSAFSVRAPARLVNGKVVSGRETQMYFVHRLFSLAPAKSAFDKRGNLTNIHPQHDFVIGTVSGMPIEVVGHIGAMPSSTVDDQKLVLHDPNAIAGSPTPWADATPGTQALVLGFPRDMTGLGFDRELVASVGEVLDDTRAKDMLSRSDPDEAAIAYDPSVELVVAARALGGMSGGAAFDEAGRYLGIAVRATVKPVDEKYLVRIVRASYAMTQLDAALARARPSVRDKVLPFLAR